MGPLTDPFGRQYDTTLEVERLVSYRIFDPVDNDMTNTRLYTIDGTQLAAAWGIDPANSGGGM